MTTTSYIPKGAEMEDRHKKITPFRPNRLNGHVGQARPQEKSKGFPRRLRL